MRALSLYGDVDFRIAIMLPTLLCFLACGPGSENEQASAAPGPKAAAAIDDAEEEAARLAALGYVEVVSEQYDDLEVGAKILNPDRMQEGLNLYVNALLCSAELMTNEGEVVKSWSAGPCLKWGNAVLAPNGDLFVIHRRPGKAAREAFAAREVMKLNWKGEILWRTKLASHHDVDVMPDGRIATLTYKFRVIPKFDKKIPVRDHFIAILSPDGELLEEVSLTKMMSRSSAFERFRPVKVRVHDGQPEVDLIHSNAIEWMRDPKLAEGNPLYALTNLLICSRTQNAVMIINWETKEVIWSWGQGDLSGPHDATVLSNGNILVFDNGLIRKKSRVVEVDPRTNEIVWVYEHPGPDEFFTKQRGAAQRLPNGNTLITDSGAGRVFEVTTEGETVWSFVNPNRNDDGERVVIVRTRRVQGSVGDEPHFEWSD